MPELGRGLIVIGLLLVIVGGALSFLGRVPWIGRLPGDIYIQRENFSFYFPLGTCVVLSVVMTLLLWALRR